jgi:ubiquinone/menaquinone biosynthesis C-methylase UbiE
MINWFRKKSHKLSSHLSKKQRGQLARKLRKAREFDRNGEYNRERSLGLYNTILNFNIKTKIQQMISKQKSPVKILDIGSGQNTAGTSLKKIFQNNIDIETIGLSKGSQHKKGQNRIGAFENAKFNKKFDLIISAMGVPYMTNTPFVVEKICNLLSINGEAHFTFNNKQIRILEKIENKLKKQGFEVEKDYKTYYDESPDEFEILTVRIKRKSKKEANLTGLIKRELRKPINSNLTDTLSDLST